MQKRLIYTLLCGLLLLRIPLFAQYPDSTRVLYDSLFTHLNSLVSEQNYVEIERITREHKNAPFIVHHMLVMQRNRALVKQGIRSDEIIPDCVSSINQLRNRKDSLSIYLSARLYEILGHTNYQRSNLFTGLNYLDSTTTLYNQLDDYSASIYNLNMIGQIYLNNQEISQALKYFHRAIDLFHEHPVDSNYYFEVLQDLGNLHTSIGQHDIALTYYLKIHDSPSSRKYPEIQADLYVNLGNIAQKNDQPEQANRYYRSALSGYIELGDSSSLATLYHNLGSLYQNQDDKRDSALYFFKASIAIKNKHSNITGRANSETSIAQILLLQGDLEGAKQMATQALQHARAGYDGSIVAHALHTLATIDARTGNWQSAYERRTEYARISDSLHLLDRQMAVTNSEQLYSIDKQQKYIEEFQLNEAIRKEQLYQSTIINYALGGATVLLLAILTLLVINFRQKQLAKNSLFNKELEVTTAEALVKGQEEERQRLAHELHDKVGNHITVLKNYIAQHKVSDQQLEQMVQDMSSEVRSISQDLMTPVLQRFGLADAMHELCSRYREQYRATIDLNIDQQDFYTFPDDKQLNIYRLLHEILQILLFDHKANYLLLEMKWVSEGISIHIEDNGTKLQRVNEDNQMILSRWHIVEHRIKFLKGEFKRSSHNQGSEYSITIPR